MTDRCVEILRKNNMCLPRGTPKLNAKVIEILKRAGIPVGPSQVTAPLSPPPAPVVKEEVGPIQTFYTSLPETMTCPCCKVAMSKFNFGVRVMKRDAEGQPLVMRRQSWCRSCR